MPMQEWGHALLPVSLVTAVDELAYIPANDCVSQRILYYCVYILLDFVLVARKSPYMQVI